VSGPVRAEDALDVAALAAWLATHADPQWAGVDLTADALMEDPT